ncbi:MFS transporter [Catenulispora pinisilvae]|uniref:MFS transporter n=1 Tax=Catenulispora pinisilvae TaxID=2705253 RepID=UPI001892696D|nr:MFS transporter [Catenulispora pinisilvae]
MTAADPRISPDLAGRAAAVQRRTVRVLIGSQILGGVGSSTGFSLSTLLAKEITGNAALSGLTGTFSSLGAAFATIPLSRVMAARGRRPGLVLGYGAAVVGTVVVVLAARLHLYPLLLVGMALFGSASAMNLQARYAGTDLAPAERRGRALSMVIWAVTIGSIFGPNLGHPAEGTARVLGLPPLAGAFLWSGFALCGAALVLGLFLRPDPLLVARELRGEDAAAPKRLSLKQSFAVIGESPRAVLAIAVVAVSHTVMVSVMSMTPVHMNSDGMSVTVIGLVLSVHITGMYAFSPLVGFAVDRVGRIPVLSSGMAILAAACLVLGSAPMGSRAYMAAGLLLLGIGWSCGVVAGSTLLTESTPDRVRPSVQGASDFVMQGSSAGGAALAGLVVGTLGYSWLAGLGVALLAPVAVLVAVTSVRRPAAADNIPGRSVQEDAAPQVP